MFCRDICACKNKDNWEQRIDSVKSIFNKWQRRNLSQIGKITMIKYFKVSQFVYLIQSISFPDEALRYTNRLFFQFLWKNNTSNKKAFEMVQRKIMCNDTETGGLNMINIMFALQKSVYH